MWWEILVIVRMCNNFNKNYNYLFKYFYFVICGMYIKVYVWKLLFFFVNLWIYLLLVVFFVYLKECFLLKLLNGWN